MAEKKKVEVNAEDLDFGEKFVGANATNPMFSSIFNQPASVSDKDFEYRVVQRNELHDFPNHPFKVVVNEEMVDLRDSIIENGILQPLIVAPRNEGGYTILSGHRRCKAAELAQISSVPVIITKNINDAQATIMMVDSNKQREVILPSERAKAYKMKMEAMSRQGQRSDLTLSPLGTKLRMDFVTNGHEADIVNGLSDEKQTCAPLGHKLKSRDILADEEGVSKNQISRYIRLTYLIPQLLDLVDNDAMKQSPSMAFRPAVEISYLTPEEQKYFYDTVKTLDKTPSVQQATQIKELSKSGSLTQTRVMEILMADKPNQRETVRMDYDKLRDYYDSSLSPKECENKVFESLDGMKKIRSAVSKHIPKQLTDSEMATLIENLLVEHIKSHPQTTRQTDYQR